MKHQQETNSEVQAVSKGCGASRVCATQEGGQAEAYGSLGGGTNINF